ncbi:MAG: hypothetical protein ACK5GN_03095 [Pseudomonadota bacterium]|jgi:hypothetical protein
MSTNQLDLTIPPVGDVSSFHAHIHVALADDSWLEGIFRQFPDPDIATLSQAFTDVVLSELGKLQLI